MRCALVAVTAVLLSLAPPASSALADPLRPGSPPGFPGPGRPGRPLDDTTGIATSCWFTAQVFRSLASGSVPFCRGHLRYRPGDFDCYQITEQVCSVYLPTSAEWTETRRPLGPTVFPCPDGPEPPVCPRFTLQ